jgi:hypothetical protein
MQEFGQDVSYGGSSSSSEGGAGADGSSGKSPEELEKEAMSLDRIFVKKATTGW